MRKVSLLIVLVSVITLIAGCANSKDGDDSSVTKATNMTIEVLTTNAPTTAEVTTAVPITVESTTEEPIDKPEITVADYSSYLGTWSYKNIPDEIPDEILQNEDSYQMYMERIPSTTLVFKEINGNEVKFELTKGNILTVADTVDC